MARDTLPRGSSLLALAGSTAVVRPAEEPPVPPPAPSAPTASSPAALPRQREKAPRQIVRKPGRDDARPTEPATERAPVERRQKINARLPAALAEAVRDCVVYLSGPPHGMTMDGFAEEAYRRELERLKRAHHDGDPFPTRPYNPKPGRRIT